MKKLMFPLAAILLMSSGVTSAHATDVYISSDSNDSAVSGIIEKVSDDIIRLKVNGEILEVDVDKLDLDNGQDSIIKKGDEVRFTGRFNDDEFIAESLRLLTPSDDVKIVE